MAADDPRGQARLLALIGIGAAVLLIGAVVLVVLVQLFAPAFGVSVGAPSDAIIGSMLVWAGIALGVLPVSVWMRKQ